MKKATSTKKTSCTTRRKLKTDLLRNTCVHAPARNTTRPKTRFTPGALTLCLAVTLFSPAPFLHTQQAFAQTKGPIQRVVDGGVNDKAGAAIPGAVVYLKNIKTLSVTTFICAADGKFHFGQLSQDEDYELWAELNGKRSKSKHISSFSSQNKFNFSLTIE